ncbi:MAG: DUF456 domain-containing protein [Candidatus Omnitrophica bacterium]|nr:DUF456 domain-containing protein [Candidatus Omnitrophota bacterium]
MEIAGTVLFILFSFVGIAVIFLSLPGTFIILAGALLYAFLTHFGPVGRNLILVLFFMAVLAESADNILAMLGAKKTGASRESIVAVFIGSIAGAAAGGMIVPVIGSLAGAFVGGAAAPFAVEYFRQKNLKRAFRAGMGSLTGRAGGILLKFIIAVGMVVIVLKKIF